MSQKQREAQRRTRQAGANELKTLAGISVAAAAVLAALLLPIMGKEGSGWSFAERAGPGTIFESVMSNLKSDNSWLVLPASISNRWESRGIFGNDEFYVELAIGTCRFQRQVMADQYQKLNVGAPVEYRTRLNAEGKVMGTHGEGFFDCGIETSSL